MLSSVLLSWTAEITPNYKNQHLNENLLWLVIDVRVSIKLCYYTNIW